MEFYDVINSRRTIRDFTDRPVDMDTVKRVLSAGLKAPTNNHMREWEFVVITDREMITSVLKKTPKKATDKRVEFIIKSWGLKDEIQKNMYRDSIPKQYEMLSKSGCLILPFFKQNGDLFKPKNFYSLSPFASIWCCIENIFLAATAEGLATAMHIPFGDEPEHIAEVLKYPKEYVMPCYIALGYPAADAVVNQQIEHNIEDKIHINSW